MEKFIENGPSPAGSQGSLEKPDLIPNPGIAPDEDLPQVDLRKYFQKTPDLLDPQSTSFHRGPRSNSNRKVIAWSLTAALVDFLLMVFVTCFLLVAFSLLVKAQLSVVFQILGSSAFQTACAGIASLSVIYLVMFRLFLGFTIGEWACDLRLGTLKQRLQSTYSLRVILRTVVIFATGVVTLPLLSLITGRDVPGLLSRLPLIQVDPSADKIQRDKSSK